MELKKIEIKNFRSIKDASIDFDQNCKVLVGKNDAGKSNVLKAIAAVFDEYKVTPKDKRKRIGNEIIKPDDYYIRAIFELSDNDFDEVLNLFLNKFPNIDQFKKGLGLSVSNFIHKNFKKVLRRISIVENVVSTKSYYSVQKSELKTFENLIFENGSIIEGTPNIDQTISKVVFECIKEHWEEYVSKCYYWSYSNSYLLPNSVNITEFKTNPSCCEPLKNVFELCDRSDISSQFSNALLEDGDYDNLLDQISQEVTNVFQNIWGDFKDTQIELRPNGDEISIKIKEKVKYNFEDRSDGFKKFISILLMISTRVRKESIDELEIVLFYEPDQSLYPSSARYLRDELLKLSDKTKIIYSTHSQYMIDSDCVERHIVVEKNNDITTLKNYNLISPFSDDELLRNAIGSSIFESLKINNIIFEGWLDKQLFEFYLKSNPSKAKKFENIGRVFLSGISSVETLVQILILANKNFIIVADSDQASKNKRNDFSEKYEEYIDRWIGYADVLPKVETMEDFLKNNFIESKLINKKEDFKYNSDLSAIKNIECIIRDKEEKQLFKKKLIAEITKTDLKSEYSMLIDQILLKIGNR
jgi:AAA15 family ATPase/GTPase